LFVFSNLISNKNHKKEVGILLALKFVEWVKIETLGFS